jgi:cysteinyl-tRNA synthetase
MKLFNTLVKEKVNVAPIDSKTVRIYSCGPTVYDHAHIGNLSAYIFADTLRRVAAQEHTVKHVMNYTDVDDKTIKRSLKKYPNKDSKESLHKLTDEYIQLFLNDMKAIGNDVESLTFVRATDTIENMQKLITDLHDKGFAYTTDDGVYFSIEAYKKSGKKYGQLLEITTQNTSEQRIDNDEYDKESVHDFALWKKQKGNEPAWNFELDGKPLNGRPGWHIECSAMSALELGQPFDIHTGGIDLIFPHHENEIAQSTALSDSPVMATIFAHNNHILVDNKKMAKSANNFYTLDDVTKKGYDPLAFRLMILQSHYKSEAHFSWENLEAAQNRLNELRAWADLRHQPHVEDMPVELDDLWGTTLAEMKARMSDDLDTPGALASLSNLVNYMVQHPVPKHDGDNTGKALAIIDSLLGLGLNNRPDISDDQKQLLEDRQKARNDKDFALSDKLRDELKQQGLEVRDTDYGQIWGRI